MLPTLDRIPRFERGVHTPRTWDGPRCDLLAAGHIALEPGARYRFDNRRREEDACVLQVTLAGRGVLRELDAGRERPLLPGDAFILDLPSPTAYWLPAGARWRFCYLYFTGALARAQVAALNRRRGRCFALEDADPAVARIAAVLELLRQGGDPDEAAVSAALYAALVHLHPRPAAPDPPLARARACIEERFADPELGMQAIARQVGLSRFHLSRTFKAAFGLSPYAYLLAVRFRHAQELLRAGGQTARQVARAVGFADPVHFAHAFRRHVGVTPGAYKARAGAGHRSG